MNILKLILFFTFLIPIQSFSEVVRLSDSTGNVVDKLSAIPVNSHILVTTAKEGVGGNLLLQSWRVDDDGSMTERDSIAAGAVTAIDTVLVSPGKIVSAVRQNDSNLKVIAWSVGSGGAIDRLGSESAGNVSALAVSRYANDKFVIAAKDGAGELKLISWQIRADGSVIRLGSSSAGAIKDVKLEYVGADRVVTGVKMMNDKLKLILWRVAENGSIERLADSGDQAGEIGDVDLRAVSPQFLVSAISEKANENLKLITWDVSNTNIKRLASVAAGSVSGLSIFSKNQGNFADLYTAVKTKDKSALSLILWSFNGDDYFHKTTDKVFLDRITSTSAGQIGLVDVSYMYDKDVIVTVVKDSQGFMKLISWRYIPPPPAE
ncbi:hypothetical protein [Thiothrix nivea]|uniref:Uncharacterized protein n=1 Tax=Thiothrix nivea (strain ATCC 35100 / DSM 5205 / JP2) TaxID=870187 RepID=A0A656HB47_THINJ|nr:hypothetical protein [Thiothrix nivea]EIJ34028.1 hypothetical protein Thini_1425 [Thiothrix nivea DSM 5205]